ncbi:methyl-accepting chemotaxis protein [Rhodoferax sp.]|uniref:methyl-accepting chemotaxis protein n=1 Tax=Rhodoferax sp. TaxID=50421 RepID=UPI002ACD3617|nr:methyl-accepting chemotaxis protein [Rhodoferax sp.]MDZ7921480.1 methyl-accepting chemotaxis protein [Rhodoferax sp.]
MKLRQKLLIPPILTAVILLGLSLFSTWLLQKSRIETEERVATVIGALGVFTGTQDQIGRVHASAYRTVTLAASLDEAKIKEVKADIETQVVAITRAISTAAEIAGEDEVADKALKGVKSQLKNYVAQTTQALDLASFDPNTGAVAMQQADATFAEVGKSLGSIVARLDAQLTDSLTNSRERAQGMSVLFSVLGLCLAGAVIAVAAWMQNQVVRELHRAVAVTNDVASGNLQVDTGSSKADEVGDLIRALGRMSTQLSQAMREVLNSSNSIRLSSAEIASGTLDLSQRTEQAASNLARTASSMQQLTGTVLQSADSARTANTLAGSAAQVAARGGSQVGQVVTTMEDINSSSRKIGDIIGVIDGIAFQTNILALNAAVEAARAGEQGRGFAVVASEVRSLAGRSAEAAREIKALIGASVDKVEGGSRLVAASGQTMTEIVESVQRVSDIIADITTTADGQGHEIREVNASIAELDQMTQQNAALVEQSSAAADSLKDQAIKLGQIVATFKLREVELTRGEPLRLQ